MAVEVPVAVAYVGTFVAIVGGGVALFNSWKAVSWKRAELANSYLKDFSNNAELVFAGRCLDWNGGRLALAENLICYTDDEAKTIKHDRAIFARALAPELTINEMERDTRIQIYRTAMDSFLSWLSLVSSALDRKLFTVQDIEDVGYWIAKIQSEPPVRRFIDAYGYSARIDSLAEKYRKSKTPYSRWYILQNLIFYRS